MFLCVRAASRLVQSNTICFFVGQYNNLFCAPILWAKVGMVLLLGGHREPEAKNTTVPRRTIPAWRPWESPATWRRRWWQLRENLGPI